MKICKRFSFDSSHHLTEVPSWHPCGKVHGHTYQLEVWVDGPLDQHGWVIDFKDLGKAVEPTLKKLDHDDLNACVANPTAENLIVWLWTEIRRSLPSLCRLVLHESSTTSVEYEG